MDITKEEELKDQLIDEVIQEILSQQAVSDYTAIDELLRYVPVKNLIQFLDEEKWGQYKKLLDKQ